MPNCRTREISVCVKTFGESDTIEVHGYDPQTGETAELRCSSRWRDEAIEEMKKRLLRKRAKWTKQTQ